MLKIAPFKLPDKKLQKYNEKNIIHSAIIRGSQLSVGPKKFWIEVIKFEVVWHCCHFTEILLHFPVTDLFRQWKLDECRFSVNILNYFLSELLSDDFTVLSWQQITFSTFPLEMSIEIYFKHVRIASSSTFSAFSSPLKSLITEAWALEESK